LDFFIILFRAPFQIFKRPDKYARSYGVVGCLFGFIVSPFHVIWRILNAFYYSVDRLLTGFYNSCKPTKRRLNVLPGLDKQKLYYTEAMETELKMKAAEQCPKSRKMALRNAFKTVLIARELFNQSSPNHPQGHYHYKLAKCSYLLNRVKSLPDDFLPLSTVNGVTVSLKSASDTKITFSEFCLMIYKAAEANAHTSFRVKSNRLQSVLIKEQLPSMAQLYLTDDKWLDGLEEAEAVEREGSK